jgi:glycine C-acetyltransferase
MLLKMALLTRAVVTSKIVQTHFRCIGTVLKKVNEKLDKELEAIREAGTWKSERIITSKQDVAITVQGSKGSILNFCANNYLGLSVIFLKTGNLVRLFHFASYSFQSHPDVVQAGIDGLKSHGAGLSSVRFICGTQDIHKKLESQIAQFHGRDDAILYASCFDANAGLFEQLLGPEDAVLSDALNHASIIDGIRLCKAKKYRYAHKDMKGLLYQFF